jgi:hypothetical protein
MNMPGFSAGASLYPAGDSYAALQAAACGGDYLIRQAAVYPPVYNRCTWLDFCCHEYRDPWCCLQFWSGCRLL